MESDERVQWPFEHYIRQLIKYCSGFSLETQTYNNYQGGTYFYIYQGQTIFHWFDSEYTFCHFHIPLYKQLPERHQGNWYWVPEETHSQHLALLRMRSLDDQQTIPDFNQFFMEIPKDKYSYYPRVKKVMLFGDFLLYVIYHLKKIVS